MSADMLFPSLEGFEPTRASLHLYANAVGVVPRMHAPAHPKWWHISLRVVADGLVTTVIPLPDSGTFRIKLDLRHHNVAVETSLGGRQAISMRDGLTGTEFGDQVVAAVAELGLEGEYAREKFESDEAREYDADAAQRFLTALTHAHRIFARHRANLSGSMGPVQLWPHGFDLAMEWFGTRVETYEHDGEVTEYPSQINLGFYPAGDPYFYSNPWPFEKDAFWDRALPAGARWTTEGFEGSILPYSSLVGDSQAEAKLLAYARAVFDIASPTILD